MPNIFSLTQLPTEMPLANTGLTVGGAIEIIQNVVGLLNFNTIYRVDVLSATNENKIMNTLYYRFDSIIPGTGQFAGADNCAFQVEQEVIPPFRNVLARTHLIEEIRVTPFTPLFERKLKMPYVEHVGLYGTRYGVDTAKSQRQSAKLRFNLSPHGWAGYIQSMFGLLPTSGRIYVGPLGWGDVGTGEVINNSGLFTGLENLAEKLADGLYNAAPPGNFVPVRVKRLGFEVPEAFRPIIGKSFINVYTSWADVDSVQVDTEVTFLKSREL